MIRQSYNRAFQVGRWFEEDTLLVKLAMTIYDPIFIFKEQRDERNKFLIINKFKTTFKVVLQTHLD